MRNFLADTTALVVFFTLTGMLNERYVAGMDWREVAKARLIGAPLMVLTARPYGLWRDWVMYRSGAVYRGGMRAFWFDTLALLSFQVPLYAAIVWSSGADGSEVLHASAGAAVIMLISGRPYGLWLDLVRTWYGLPANRR